MLTAWKGSGPANADAILTSRDHARPARGEAQDHPHTPWGFLDSVRDDTRYAASMRPATKER